jgi:hypothetical protein
MRKINFLLVAAVLFLFPTLVSADTVNVDCGNPSPPPGSFSSISGALSTLSFIGPNTINVTGICGENLNLTGYQNLTIQATSLGAATISPGSPNTPAFSLISSRLIVFRRLILKRGMRIGRDSEATLDTCTIEDSTAAGVNVGPQAIVTVSGCTIQNNAAAGLRANSNSSVILGGNNLSQAVLITNNGGGGISGDGSAIDLNGNVTIENNSGNGLAMAGGRLNLNGNNADNIVRNNTFSGVFLTGSASAAFLGQNIIQNNPAIGVAIIGSSAVFNQLALPGASVRATLIEGSENSGITVAHSGHASLQGHHRIRNNGSTTNCPSTVCGGVRAFNSSTFELSNGVEITNNTGPGIFTDMHADIVVTTPVTVAGNTGGDVQLTLSSGMIVLSGPTTSAIGSVTCDDTGFLSGELGGIALIDCKNVIVQKKNK